ATLAKRIALLPNVIAVTEAIAYAHAEKVIHRDLKPANVLVGKFGETVVIDWGLAKDLAETETETETAGPFREGSGGLSDATAAGKVMGTPAYMPVEQARGEAIDARADVYALGAMLYHVLAGTAPYARDDESGVPWETMLARVPRDRRRRSRCARRTRRRIWSRSSTARWRARRRIVTRPPASSPRICVGSRWASWSARIATRRGSSCSAGCASTAAR
nr:protein kinase [Kofleriaceae bacterium]